MWTVIILLSIFTFAECKFMQVNTTTRMFTDAAGRERIFHGVNVVYKVAPYYPPLSSFHPQLSFGDEDVEFLVQNGYSMVRLFVSWRGVEPEKDSYNSSYLDVIEGIVNKLGESGIYSVLDCHQDLMSPKFCGEGFPDYATLYENRSSKSLPFPVPIPSLTPYKINNTTGYPYRDDCAKHPFYLYYLSDACCKAWQSLYDNDEGILERFGLFWEQVAQRFSSNEFVLAYELLNEPWAGDIYSYPQDFLPDVINRKYLLPLYQRLHQSIRKHDDNHIIFFEPVSDFVSEVVGPSWFGEGPGGHEYDNRQAFSFHIYCALMKKGQPSNIPICKDIESNLFSARMLDMEEMGLAGFVTEWGAYDDFTTESDSFRDAQDITSFADRFLLSWSYWQFKGYGDITTQSNSDEGFWNAQGKLEELKVRTLSYPYAMSVGGHYKSMQFVRETSRFELTYVVAASASDNTTIFLSEKFYYPNGFNATVMPSTWATLQHRPPYLLVKHTSVAQAGQVISVGIAPVS
ncbi:endoglycoceramidase-like [Corticium candelabrum]|uniref:endoglycoceramidase-like n=1 Tax=Corticium candelabrum TaxID=121492 RepID=UPI002E2533D0|nr:endoglycoceramidase-like [Corticium candelabrum]